MSKTISIRGTASITEGESTVKGVPVFLGFIGPKTYVRFTGEEFELTSADDVVVITQEERDALADLLPKVEVANVVRSGSAACRAIAKLCPSKLTRTQRKSVGLDW